MLDRRAFVSAVLALFPLSLLKNKTEASAPLPKFEEKACPEVEVWVRKLEFPQRWISGYSYQGQQYATPAVAFVDENGRNHYASPIHLGDGGTQAVTMYEHVGQAVRATAQYILDNGLTFGATINATT